MNVVASRSGRAGPIRDLQKPEGFFAKCRRAEGASHKATWEQRGGHPCLNCCGDAKQGGLLRTLILTPRPSLFVSSRVGGGGRACVDGSGGASGPGVPPPPTGGRSGGGFLATRKAKCGTGHQAAGSVVTSRRRGRWCRRDNRTLASRATKCGMERPAGFVASPAAARTAALAVQAHPHDPRAQVRHGAAGGLHGDPRVGAIIATRAVKGRTARRRAPADVAVQAAGLAAADLLFLVQQLQILD
jgi:hypothetical protein